MGYGLMPIVASGTWSARVGSVFNRFDPLVGMPPNCIWTTGTNGTFPADFPEASDAEIISAVRLQDHTTNGHPGYILFPYDTVNAPIDGFPSPEGTTYEITFQIDTAAGISVSGFGSNLSFAGLPAGFKTTALTLHITLKWSTQPFKWVLDGAGTKSAVVNSVGTGYGDTSYVKDITGIGNVGIFFGVYGLNATVTMAASNRELVLDRYWFTGTYDIEAFWWTTGVHECDETGDSKFALVSPEGTPPAGMVLAGADPVPVVTSIEPVSGPKVGGQAVTVMGSGFGLGAGVTFDGVAATSVVVVDQYLITCVSPAHAVGNATVVVTNTTVPI